eukprot:XP_001709841.1 Hypothetical protein GL50803_8461 [Giardia lamblia ATCC 50803]
MQFIGYFPAEAHTINVTGVGCSSSKRGQTGPLYNPNSPGGKVGPNHMADLLAQASMGNLVKNHVSLCSRMRL